MLNYKIEPTPSNIMSTIGGKDRIIKGIGTVSLSWTDNLGNFHTKKLNNVIYFSALPVYILIATALSESLKDDEVTWVLTKIKFYIFTWDSGK